MGLYTLLPMQEASLVYNSIDFILGLPQTAHGFDSIFLAVDRFFKMARFIPCAKMADAIYIVDIFFKEIVRLYGIPATIVPNWDVKFVRYFW